MDVFSSAKADNTIRNDVVIDLSNNSDSSTISVGTVSSRHGIQLNKSMFLRAVFEREHDAKGVKR